ncbi:type II toxin-antitoxin system VapC family toxin [Arthrospira platensis]|uniref:type II toxin-antitoxin system VapC family toxin n=1 Tax=Limnospira TaxID=2596745 RepID=UPI0001C39241|nr:type II toxin-antitoxin system VapC family toxin [Arthrospira platensis]AMW29519.1 twitching motility protein PilT [Arthrospira platensis YZ]KDR56926.1 twitching motility protein PilT [Arthrospira platensis str. Paraca]MBD2669050.1 type II toxin-antitoxin system VapC family toxin [Arthrospira platensis FACHB-439]MBD2709541.1 type II toxin-antitoxin system VapC family toxin [Arthrospira platensis FACHB-835]MDT9309600.1 type II toxin-antitoxin system VapC family toxin [Limnospira sp. Paracas 
MRLLLDTHTILWFFMGNSRLSDKVRDLVEDGHNHKLISVATVWEMSIKQSQNKLTLEKTASDYIEEKIRLDDFELLPIQLNHLRILSSLPFYHKDPFDRLLIAQSMQENIPILSKDMAFNAYPIQRIWD